MVMATLVKCFKYFSVGLCIAFLFSVKAVGGDRPLQAEGVIKKDAVWAGEVLVAGDVLVPEGVTLTIEPGTKVMFAVSDSSKIEPMFLSMQTELLVRGRLVVRGEKGMPAYFGPAPEGMSDKKPARGDWGGIIFDGQAASGSSISYAGITMADSAIAAYNSSPSITGCTVDDSRYGLVCEGLSRPKLTGCTITGSEFGVVATRGGKPVLEGCKVEKNEHNFLTRD